MIGTASELHICGVTIKKGDFLKIRYKNGGTTEGDVVELWDGIDGGISQARLSSGWCFHNSDEIVTHNPKGEKMKYCIDCEKEVEVEVYNGDVKPPLVCCVECGQFCYDSDVPDSKAKGGV